MRAEEILSKQINSSSRITNDQKEKLKEDLTNFITENTFIKFMNRFKNTKLMKGGNYKNNKNQNKTKQKNYKSKNKLITKKINKKITKKH